MDLILICMGGVVVVYRTVRDTDLAEMTEKERSDKTEDGQVPPPSYYETVGPMSEAGPVEVEVERLALVLGEERVEVTCRACSKRVRLSFDHNCNPPPSQLPPGVDQCQGRDQARGLDLRHLLLLLWLVVRELPRLLPARLQEVLPLLSLLRVRSHQIRLSGFFFS